ncbi:MAG: hydrogenase 4 subunit F [Elusimicrobiaceae bacterium]
MQFLLVLSVPALTALACLALKNPELRDRASTLGATVSLGVISFFAWSVIEKGPVISRNTYFYADALSVFMLFIVGLLGLASAAFSTSYMRHEAEKNAVSQASLRTYYPLLHFFIFAMLLTTLANNLGLMWISIEATTLISVFFVGFYRKKASIEAAWKYMILCTVGIAFALFGTLMLYFSASVSGVIPSLNWSELAASAHKLNPKLVKLSFIFILLGYGTKAGLAPMHTWLPDTHSQSPTPISALLSGVLIKCAIYGILRFHILALRCLGADFSGKLFLFFGILSLCIATPFILFQRDYKRLLAYCSIEHIGIICVGIGFGGPLGIFGALFHMFNHAIAKALMFLTGGGIAVKYGTKKLQHVTGVLKAMPVTGPLFAAGVLALAGFPPFSLFVSEFYILVAGIAGGNLLAASLFAVMIVAALAGLLFYVFPVLFGSPRKHIKTGEHFSFASLVLCCMALVLATAGFHIPGPLHKVLNQILAIFGASPV